MDELSKNEKENIWKGMLAAARRIGPDPESHLSIHHRFERDYNLVTVIVDQLLRKLTVAPEGGYKIETQGWWGRLAATLRHPLTSAAIIIAAGVIYMDSRTFEKPSARQEYQRIVGQAILDAKPEVQTTMGAKEITVTISGKRLNGADATLHLEHKLSEVDFQRLRQNTKK